MKKDFNRKLHKFSAALKSINVEKIFMQAVKETSELALDLNRSQMTELSVDSEGKALGTYKGGRRKGKPIILRDTGKFQDRMFVDTRQLPIMLDSKDPKVPIIKKRWPKALGLIPQFTDQYKDRVMNVFNGKIDKVIEDKKKILQ